jgi:foldase protein PrsA
MLKKIFFVLLILAVIPVWIGCGGLPKSAVAQVDDKVITREDLDKQIENLKKQYGEQGLPVAGTPEYVTLQKDIVAQLVEQEVVSQEAKEMGIDVTSEDVDEQIDQYIQMTGGEEAFQAALDERGYTLPDLKAEVHKALLQQKVLVEVTKDVQEVSDEEALDYYNQHKNDPNFQKPETRRVRHILVADEATAASVKAQLDAGGDFVALAKQYSTENSSKENGGDLGEIASLNSGQVPPEVEPAMNQLAAGQTSGPVKSSIGYHIIRVDEIIPAKTLTFEETAEEIKSSNFQQKQQQTAMDWITEAKKRHDITYADEFKPDDLTSTGTTGDTAPADATAAPAPQG